ncbi:MAG: hypothetical protein V2I39_13980 [Erythrobacter sp.]|jgi:hypothetical protein|nr:hypothetical protein [Erythrobacter sp.]
MVAHAPRLACAAMLLALGGCQQEGAGEGERSAAPTPLEPVAWDGRKANEADAIVTLDLEGEATSVLLNGEPARALIDNLAKKARVLVPSSDAGISCENSYIVTFADGEKGQLVANHCHSDEAFRVRPGEIASALVTKQDVDDPADDFAQGSADLPLSFEWSANGFETLPGEFRWSGGDDAGGGTYALLGVPETDNQVFSAECRDATVTAIVLLHDREPRPGMDETFKTQVEGRDLRTYRLEGVSYAEGAAFRLVLPASDPLWRDLAAGQWAYWQVGSDSGRGKLRVPLENAGPHIRGLVAGC